MLRFVLQQPSAYAYVYPVKDYEYKGGSQWIIGNDDSEHYTSGS